jgi:NADH pyrophosphatase NudC (nudix superfamily)
MALLGALILVVAVVAFILQPVLQGHWASLRHEDEEMTEVEARRRVTLLALRDAEYDFAMGKLDENDYQALKRQLSAEALAALEALEKSGGRDAVEAEIAAARQQMEEEVRCGACLNHNPAGSRFCGACGAALAPQETAGAP